VLRKNIFLVFIIILASILRLWQLGSIPSGLSNDEAGYIYSAYSLWNTGHDVAGKFLPLSINLDASFSPVYIYLTAPFVGILGLSPFAVLLLYLLTKKMLRDRRIALAAAFVLAVSPWHLQISRAALDATVAMFFYLFALLVFCIKVKKGSILWSLPLWLLAFYSYHATKLFYLGAIPLLVVYFRDTLLKRKKEIALFLLGALLIIVSFIMVMKTQGVTRQGIFIYNDMATITQKVDWERTFNSSPEVLKPIFNNKFLYIMRMVRENYLEAFSFHYLFLYGEPGGLGIQYGLYYRGVMYLIELPLLLIGLYQLARQKAYLPLLMLLAAPLGSAFNLDKQYVNRSIMMLPFLSMAVAVGLIQVLNTLRRKGSWKIYTTLLAFAYVAFIVSYLYQYYYRYSIYGAEKWFYSSRETAGVIQKGRTQYDKVYVSDMGPVFLLQYGIWAQVEPSKIQKAWQEYPKTQIDNVSFVEKCSLLPTNADPNKSLPRKTMYIVQDECHKSATPSAVIKEKGEPLRTIFKIYKSH
jgi:4-amino-4-deoxy-L-arabinose transferase-like glycosyltransferase